MSVLGGWATGWLDALNPARASHRLQLVYTALFSGAFVGAAILSFQSDKKTRLLSLLKASIPEAEQDPIADKVSFPSHRDDRRTLT